MSTFTLYLQLDEDNNFVWTGKAKPKEIGRKIIDASIKPPSRLDFNVANGQKFKLVLGDSLSKTWRFDSREISPGRKCCINVKRYRHPGDGKRRSGECSFNYKETKKSITITDFESDIGAGSAGSETSFEFDMYLENFSADGLITKVIIDPILNNNGGNGP